MSRERFVTRTISFTAGTAMIVDLTEEKVSSMEYRVSGTPKGNDLLEAVKKALETPIMKVVAIQTVEVLDRLFSMKEDDFMKYATESDPRPVYPSQEKQKEERK